VHPFSVGQEGEQPFSCRTAVVRQSETIVSHPVAVLQPGADVHAHSRHESLEHTVLQGQSGYRCARPPTTQLRVTARPEDDHRTQVHNSFDDEDLLFWKVEESLQQKMEGRTLATSHQHRLPSSKVQSSAVHFPGQTNFNPIVCSAAFPQEDRASSRSTQGAGRECRMFQRGSRRLWTFNLSSFLTRRGRCDKLSYF